MKKFLVSLFLVFVFSAGCSYSQETQNKELDALKRVVEIGALVNSSHYDKAFLQCEEALKEYPNNADLYYWKASIYVNKNDNKNAMKNIQKALEINKDEASYYVLRGSIYSHTDKHDLAISDFDKTKLVIHTLPVGLERAVDSALICGKNGISAWIGLSRERGIVGKEI